MPSRSSTLLACLACLAALLVLACRPSSGPVTPLAPPAPRIVEAPPPPPPVSLTASDGTGLVLASLRARAVIDDPLALTELELEFDNPRPDTIEGRFELLLPPGARVTRFALQVNGQWQEAEVVERLAARQAYEAALYEGLDPALLEQDSGNRFGARVFPIEPYARKRVLVSYVEEFADPAEPWRLAVLGLPGLQALELDAQVVDATGRTQRLQRSLPAGQAPTADFVVPRAAPHDDGVRHGEQVTARVQPLAGIELGDAAPLLQLTVLVDTSASRALDFDASLRSLARVLQALTRHAGTAKLQVLAFDQEVVPIYSGSLVGFDGEALAALHARRPLGASDLGLALRALEDGEHPRVLLVSDGLVSLGEGSDAALRRQLQGLAAKGVERLDALVLGRVRDEDRLQRLVSGPLPSAGVLLRPELPPERAAARLVQPTLEGVRVSVPGARWWSPTRLEGVQPDDHVLVFADLPEGQPLRVQISGPVHRDIEVPLRTTRSPLHEQGWRRAQIEGLVERLAVLQDELESTRLRRHVIELSVRHRIVNELTALLVLETDDDYARFGIDRSALEDVLVVGTSGAELRDRNAPPPPPPQPQPVAAAVEGYDARDRVISLPPRKSRWRGRRSRGGDGASSGGVGTSGGDEAEPPPTTTPAEPPAGSATPRVPEPVPKLPEEESDESTPEPSVLEPEPNDAPMLDSDQTRGPVYSQTVAGMEITTEELRNIPVGGEQGRDFAQVIDTSATASRDSAGISLAGTTGAESHYYVDGASMRMRSDPEPARVLLRRTIVEGETTLVRPTRRWLRHQLDPVERCYFRALADDPSLRGRVVVQFELREGEVVSLGKLDQVGLDDPELLRCLDQALRAWEFTPLAARVTQTLAFQPGDGPPEWFWDAPEPEPTAASSPYPRIQQLLERGERAHAFALARDFRERAPIDVLALAALGDAARARGELRRAARAYGSIIDLHPSRADMLRFAAAQLESLDDPAALDVAIDAYRRAASERPDHPTGHRSLAIALLRRGEPQAAFEVLEQALVRPYPPDRFMGVQRVLGEDLGIAAAAWLRREPTAAATVHARLAALGVPLATAPSLRVVLTWESDLSDVDLHVTDDARSGTASPDQPQLATGGEIFADVGNGFGPECFAVTNPSPRVTYSLRVHHYARGPMGYGMGKLAVLHHDGAGGLRFDDRPFVAVEDDEWIYRGVVRPAGPDPSLR